MTHIFLKITQDVYMRGLSNIFPKSQMATTTLDPYSASDQPQRALDHS